MRRARAYLGRPSILVRVGLQMLNGLELTPVFLGGQLELTLALLVNSPTTHHHYPNEYTAVWARVETPPF